MQQSRRLGWVVRVIRVLELDLGLVVARACVALLVDLHDRTLDFEVRVAFLYLIVLVFVIRFPEVRLGCCFWE